MVRIEWYSMTDKNKMLTIIDLICGTLVKSPATFTVMLICLGEVLNNKTASVQLQQIKT